MLRNKITQIMTVGGLGAALIIGTTGCQELPGSPEAQGATIGGVSGAAVGAAVAGKENRLLGAILGGAIGAGGGYLIGANKDRITGKDSAAAQQAVRTAQANPATPQQARTAATADLNSDGFVTMDEVVAMEKAGLSDQEILSRLRATDQVFDLTAEQEQHLRQQGVSDGVISQLPTINQAERDRLLSQQGSVIGRPADESLQNSR